MFNRNVISGLLFSVFLIFALGSSDDRTPEQKEADTCQDTTQAFIMSQTFVKRNLKAPSTAEFPWSPSSDGVTTLYLGECKHHIVAYVDAQNGFGAMIRSKYSVTLRYKKGTDTWFLEDIEIE